jgi:cell division protease FtsH
MVAGLLAGRVSEEITFNEISDGAGHDLKEATSIARKMVTRFGMSDKLGNLTFGHPQEHIFLGRDIIEERNYSDQTAFIIDQEVRKVIDECYATARGEIMKHRDKLKLLAEKLLEKEIMELDEIKALVGIPVDEKAQDKVA